MKATYIFLLSGLAAMAHADDAIRIVPGKQLPQSLVVKQSPTGESKDSTLHYLLFVPEGYEKKDQKWPLLLFLHGRGESGDNELDKVKIHGPPSFVESRPDFPFIVVAPQCPPPTGELKQVAGAWKPEQLIQLLNHVADHVKIDNQRVYVTGLSMGGFGTWRLAAAYPERFAAALPICGGGDDPEKMAKSLRRVPIWAFHGALDKVVPLQRSEEMVNAVREAGGDVRLKVYPDVEHNSWKPTYDNPEIYDWLLSHRKSP